ncbi:MotA/TolQ/ExbB proton channel family protein [Desulfogranum japonicum]|uniref:MotA/TolQ/ExbB proton channel family protein n=1 Tax=Desulfogranum japonicum TaxID=231447 RepID=UPI0004293051|nr:MotA/TolQ/ExbB proton channel family protein [Desulfogranum japonicum]
MNHLRSFCTVAWALLLLSSPCSFAQDMRVISLEAEQARNLLTEKATQEKAAAEQAAAQSRKQILEDRETLQQAITKLQQEKQTRTSRVEELTAQSEQLGKQEEQLTAELEQKRATVGELIGTIRMNAKDLDSLASQDLTNRATGEMTSFSNLLAQDGQLPSMGQIRTMMDAVASLIDHSQGVARIQGNIVDRTGHALSSEILLIGPFTAAYSHQGETGFLTYSPDGDNLYALSRLPSSGMQKQLAQYMEGKRSSVPIDISRGNALRQLSNQLQLSDQIQRGGPIVWPIVVIFILGLLIVLERSIHLIRTRARTSRIIDQIQVYCKNNQFSECEEWLANHASKPLTRILLAGVRSFQKSREDLENILQEAILREIPPLERFLSTLGMLVAIAPLLGLLGTVTGMINVFHVITLHGTGDPRLMSGGISEALVTTMLGLGVAIPLMLLHNVLQRRVDERIGEMEEKAVSLVNLIHSSNGKSMSL